MHLTWRDPSRTKVLNTGQKKIVIAGVIYAKPLLPHTPVTRVWSTGTVPAVASPPHAGG